MLTFSNLKYCSFSLSAASISSSFYWNDCIESSESLDLSIFSYFLKLVDLFEVVGESLGDR